MIELGVKFDLMIELRDLNMTMKIKGALISMTRLMEVWSWMIKMMMQKMMLAKTTTRMRLTMAELKEYCCCRCFDFSSTHHQLENQPVPIILHPIQCRNLRHSEHHRHHRPQHRHRRHEQVVDDSEDHWAHRQNQTRNHPQDQKQRRDHRRRKGQAQCCPEQFKNTIIKMGDENTDSTNMTTQTKSNQSEFIANLDDHTHANQSSVHRLRHTVGEEQADRWRGKLKRMLPSAFQQLGSLKQHATTGMNITTTLTGAMKCRWILGFDLHPGATVVSHHIDVDNA
jgi:hypothetical protein